MAVETPQWLSVRKSAAKAEEGAMARIQRYLEELEREARDLEARMAAGRTAGALVAGAAILAQAQYVDRLEREREAMRQRIRLAREALKNQRLRVLRAQRALEVAERVLSEEAAEAHRVTARRDEQALADLAASRVGR
jgi:flagellar biosynthesis chaperone FliJ